MTPTPRQIGMKLRKLRATRGMSQTALAKKARISREHLSRLEAGRYDPSVGVVQRLAKALGVPLMELLG
jgi:XRE family transcriptional regulator, regulator of sulfur utilization